MLTNKLEGIGWFTYEVFKRMTANHPEVEWLFIFDRPYAPHFIFQENVKAKVLAPQTRHSILWKIWFDYRLPAVLKKFQPDLFVSPDGYLSLKTAVKSLPVIHDINFEHFPHNMPKWAANYYQKYFPKFAHKADRIATVSEYSKQDIIDTYRVDPNKIDIVYNGAGDFFAPVTSSKKRDIQQEVADGKPYFAFVGALNPRKNITGMLKAFELYKSQGGINQFVIIGDRMFWNEEISNAYETHPNKEDIIFTGRLEGKGLNRVLASSEGLLFVSQFEGFGIPIVEAFKCGVPVITSTTTSMPEVAGDAAILCDPDDHSKICEAMFEVAQPKINGKLIDRGFERATLFTWDRSAEMMWASIEKTLAQ